MKIFYVYVYFHLNGTPIYVGKGQGNRWLSHLKWSYNKKLDRTIKKYGTLPVVICRNNLTEQEAFETEMALINAIGRENTGTGPLFNLTDGGDGVAGRVVPEEERKIHSRTHKGKINSPEARKKMSLSRRGVPKTPEHRAAISAAHKNKKKPEYLREKFAAGQQARFRNPEERQKFRDYHANMTPEQKAVRSKKISESLKRFYREGRDLSGNSRIE